MEPDNELVMNGRVSSAHTDNRLPSVLNFVFRGSENLDDLDLIFFPAWAFCLLLSMVDLLFLILFICIKN